MAFDRPPSTLASLRAADTLGVAGVGALVAGVCAAAMVSASTISLVSRRIAIVAAAAAAGGSGVAYLKVKDHEDNVTRTRQFYLQRRYHLRQEDWAEVTEAAGTGEDAAIRRYLQKLVAYELPVVIPREHLAAAADASIDGDDGSRQVDAATSTASQPIAASPVTASADVSAIMLSHANPVRLA